MACNMFEHAYYHNDGPGRALYMDNFISTLHWSRIIERFLKQSEIVKHTPDSG